MHSPAGSALKRDLAAASIAPTLALLAAESLRSGLGLTRLGIVFLAAVILIATARGSRAAVLTAVTTLAAYKVFLDLRIGEQTTAIEDILNMAIFLVVALIAGTLAGKARDEASSAQRHSQRMELLFKTSRSLAEEREQAFWPALTQAVARETRGGALALDAAGVEVARAGQIERDGNAVALDEPLHLGRDVLRRELAEGRSSGDWIARPVPSEKPFAGVLIWEAQTPSVGTDEFVELLADLASAALARSRLQHEQVRAEATKQSEKLREALLSSISHDFRSPLAAIIGSSSSLLEYGHKFDQSVRDDLLLNIQEEAERLNEFVANLLDMTRLQSGALRAAAEPLMISSVVAAAVQRLERHKKKVPHIDMDANCKVSADPLLLEQVLYNVLDNALRYAGQHGDVEISCVTDSHCAQIVIADHGPGIRADDQAGVFNTFHFLRKNGQVNGTGLGLSISRGFVEAMGGSIEARDRRDGQRGLEVAIKLPRSCS